MRLVGHVSLSSQHESMVFTSGAATDVGKVRQLNEDSYLDQPGAYVVADGMGGHQSGDVASRLTIEAIVEQIGRGMPEISAIGELVRVANDSVRAHAGTSGREGMGSTLVGLFLVRNADDESLVVVNVGDSRCYALVDGALRQVTTDHSHVQELVERGDIAPEAAATHPERNVVTRAIGIEDVVAGDFFVLSTEQEARLLLCSDGVSGELSFEQIEEILNSVGDPLDAASALIAAVLAGRAADNATAIVVDATRLKPIVVTDEGETEVTGPRNLRDNNPEVTGPTPRSAELPEVLISAVPTAPAGDAVGPADEMPSVVLIDDVPR